MRLSQADSNGARMVLEISDKERKIAVEVKKDFKNVLRKMDDAIKTVIDLKMAVAEERPSKDDLKTKYRGRLLRYRNKIKKSFNDFLRPTKLSLEKLEKISDPEMIRLREIIIAEIGELSDGAESVMDLLDEADRDGFTKTLEKITAQMEKRQKSIIDVIDSQLTGHIDHDILGKMKISEVKFRIMRRARIIKQLVRSS
jgi:hypothetical protein